MKSSSLAAKGFLVVHEILDGDPGKVIGTSALLEPGNKANVQITLTRAVKADEEFILMAHKDNGDGAPSEATDPEFMNGDDPVRTKFSIEAATTSAK